LLFIIREDLSAPDKCISLFIISFLRSAWFMPQRDSPCNHRGVSTSCTRNPRDPLPLTTRRHFSWSWTSRWIRRAWPWDLIRSDSLRAMLFHFDTFCMRTYVRILSLKGRATLCTSGAHFSQSLVNCTTKIKNGSIHGLLYFFCNSGSSFSEDEKIVKLKL